MISKKEGNKSSRTDVVMVAWLSYHQRYGLNNIEDIFHVAFGSCHHLSSFVIIPALCAGLYDHKKCIFLHEQQLLGTLNPQLIDALPQSYLGAWLHPSWQKRYLVWNSMVSLTEHGNTTIKNNSKEYCHIPVHTVTFIRTGSKYGTVRTAIHIILTASMVHTIHTSCGYGTTCTISGCYMVTW